MHVKKYSFSILVQNNLEPENMSANKILLTFLNNSVIICFSDSKSEKKLQAALAS